MKGSFIRYVMVLVACLFVSENFQAKADIAYVIQPIDSLLRTDIRKAEVLVFLPGDSVIVTEGMRMSMDTSNSLISRQVLLFKLPEDDKEYQVMIDAPGYDTRVYPLNTKQHADNSRGYSSYVDLGKVALLRTPRHLNEVTVTATKIKMYYKGDTLVYNADAFLLPEGSMLDDLIRKLDGVSIDRQGQIFCKGRKVESLQLSGRELFNGGEIFQNIGAYAVDKIKVYEQTSAKAKFLGYDEDGKKPYVMDVKLKQEHAIGKVLNLNAGYGTANRYLGRASLLGYSERLALSASFNANNLSDSRNPDTHNDEYFWSMDNIGSDETTCIAGELQYQYDAPNGRQKIKGSVNVSSSSSTNRDRVESVNYIPSGNTFASSYSTSRFKSLRVSTYHNLRFNNNRLWFGVTPSFSYSRNNSDSYSATATFNDDPGRVSVEEIETIYSGSDEQLRAMLINRNLVMTKNDGSNINGGLGSSLTVRLPDAGAARHNLDFNASGNYNSSKSNRYERQQINYGMNPVAAIDRYAYSRLHPTHSYSVNAGAKYEANFNGNITLKADYNFSHTSQLNTYNRYLIATDAEGASLESLKFGQLPPEETLEGLIDHDNSDQNNYRANDHRLGVSGLFLLGEKKIERPGAKGELRLHLNPSLQISDRSYDYHKTGYDTVATRKSTLPSLSAGVTYSIEKASNRRKLSASLNWNSSPSLFSMGNLINVPNTSNPLYIIKGNPDLRNEYHHSASASFEYSKELGCFQHHSISATYSVTDDRIVSGTVYNSLTGVRTQSMYNVDGSRRFSAYYGNSGDIFVFEDRAFKSMGYNVGLNYIYYREVGLVGSTTTDGADITPERQIINKRIIDPSLGLSCKFGNDHSIGASAKGSFRHYSGENIQAFNASEINYRFDVSFKLPLNFSISSNLTIRSRRGYSDPNLNTDTYILNGSIGGWLKRTGIRFSIEGYDLLHQIKSVTYRVDAYGRTEAWSNTLPSYIMLRLSYHLNLQPKKKSEEY